MGSLSNGIFSWDLWIVRSKPYKNGIYVGSIITYRLDIYIYIHIYIIIYIYNYIYIIIYIFPLYYIIYYCKEAHMFFVFCWLHIAPASTAKAFLLRTASGLRWSLRPSLAGCSCVGMPNLESAMDLIFLWIYIYKCTLIYVDICWYTLIITLYVVVHMFLFIVCFSTYMSEKN